MKSIVLCTCAYNAEKTLSRAIDSVLNQSYPEFIYHICDNGSTDNTRSIILDYAKKDKRIVPSLYDVNHTLTAERISPLRRFLEVQANSDSDMSYICFLDADDEYELDFLEKMLIFAQDHNLDIASCCSSHICAKTKEDLSTIALDNDIIVSENEFGEKFSNYFRYMGAYWGKLFSSFVLKHIDYDKISSLKNITYSKDTIVNFEALRYASRIGVLAQPLHKYYIYAKSESTKSPIKRYESNRQMPEIYRKFLFDKVGYVSKENENYISGIYLRSLRNTTKVIFNSKLSTKQKLSAIYDAISHEMTIEILANSETPDSDRRELQEIILRWIHSKRIDENLNVVKQIKEILDS